MIEQGTGEPDSQVEAFLTVLQQQPTEADCQLCLGQLYDYVLAQQSGEDRSAGFDWLAQHLDSCLACATAYNLLFDMMLADSAGDLARPERIPAPDLSFLQADPDFIATIGRAIRRTPLRLTLQLNKALNALLAPAPQVALTRSSGEGRFSEKILALNPEKLPDMDVPFSLHVYADGERPGRCLVEITVEPPGLSWPDLGGRAVSLTIGDQVLHNQTDEWGTAVFSDIPVADLNQARLDIMLDVAP